MIFDNKENSILRFSAILQESIAFYSQAMFSEAI
jgi:hypothetical protein